MEQNSVTKMETLQIGLLGKKAMIHCKVKGQTLVNQGPVLTFLDKAISTRSSPKLRSSLVVKLIDQTQVTRPRGKS